MSVELLDYEDFELAGEIYHNILENFPEDYQSLIEQGLEKVDNNHTKKVFLKHINSLLLHPYLNMGLPEEENNYIIAIRRYCSKRHREIDICNEPSPGGRLSPELRKKYSKELIATNPRMIREGTVGDCLKCKSTTVKRFIWFGMSIGCIQTECENYYKRFQ